MDFIENIIVTFGGAIFSLVFIIAYLLILIHMMKKSHYMAGLTQKIMNIVLAFGAWIVILIEKANTIGELFDSKLFYCFAITIAAVAIVHSYIDLSEYKQIK